MSRTGNVVIAQAGRPTAVINASLYSIVREVARKLEAGGNIWGARNGIMGVLRDRFVDLRKPSDQPWKQIVDSPD